MQFQPTSVSGRVTRKARVVWERITFSRITILYFAFSLVHFAVQLSLQIRAFTINANATGFLERVLVEGNAKADSLPFQRDSTISLCTWVESDLNTEVNTCYVVWSGDRSPSPSPLNSTLPIVASAPLPSSASTGAAVRTDTPPAIVLEAVPTASSSVLSTTTIFVVATPSTTPLRTDDDDDDEEEDEAEDDDDADEGANAGTLAKNLYRRDTTVRGLNGESLTLDDTCLQSLNWPVSQLHNTKREDIVFMAFHFWVLGMSFIAILNESIPHILASLLTHVMVTAWAGNQIAQTKNFRAVFNRVITNGACKGTVLLPDFWEARARAEYPCLALHGVALAVSCILTWKLIKLYGWQTFKRVGASLAINRIYKIVLILSITIQLSLFFMIVTVSLWIDQLFNNVIGDLASFQTLYKVTSVVTLALLVPWLMMGWFAVRRELTLPMFFFLALSMLYLAGWGIMFLSTTFRWTFVTWHFFSVNASASVFLTCLSFVLGIICRCNFGKGLLRYLHPQDSKLEDDDSVHWEKHDIEHVPFPAHGSMLPTYAAAYGQEGYYSDEPKQPNPAMGPRFFSIPAESFAAPPITSPPPAITRNLTDVPQMKRSDSNGSDRSNRSDRSHASIVRSFHSRENDHSRNGSHSSGQSGSKRWVIE